MLRAVFTFDELTGVPKATVELAPAAEEVTLKEIFDYLKSADKRCYIAIDEFQQVTDYPEKGVEALLRSYIQFIPSVNSAIKKLVNSELVCKTAEGYVVCDRFMGEWLRNQGY